MLKLNENNEPDVSKVILAKVKCSMNFPVNISLDIIGKYEILLNIDFKQE